MENNNKKNTKVSINKKVFIRAGLFCLVCLVILGLLIFGGIKLFQKINHSTKDELTLYLEEMGKEFYEDFYYEQLGSTLEEKANFLSQYEKIGIKISLDTLSKYKGNIFKDKIDKFINKDNNQKCDKGTTKVIIYPKKPYEKTSYKMVTEIEC